MINYNFAVFILTHGRPNKVKTYKTLRKSGYTGKIYLLIDDQDKTIDEYRKYYTDKEIIVFSKEEARKITPTVFNHKMNQTAVFARNYNFIAAKKLKLDYFLQLDDDYQQFDYSSNEKNCYATKNNTITNIDDVINSVLKFLEKTNIKTIAMAQSGDFLGGAHSNVGKLIPQNKFSRKAMNAFFCKTNNKVNFLAELNDDVNTYVKWGNLGKLFLTIPKLRLHQEITQKTKSGFTESYKKYGTYIKSFFTVMHNPSSIKVNHMGKNRRFHHKIIWKNTVPEIISYKYKK